MTRQHGARTQAVNHGKQRTQDDPDDLTSASTPEEYQNKVLLVTMTTHCPNLEERRVCLFFSLQFQVTAHHHGKSRQELGAPCHTHSQEWREMLELRRAHLLHLAQLEPNPGNGAAHIQGGPSHLH